MLTVLPLFAEQKRKEVTSTEGYDFFVGFLLNGASQITPDVDKTLKLTLQAASREANKIAVTTKNGTQEYDITAGNSTTINLTPADVYVDNGEGNETETVVPKGVRVYSKTNKPFTLFASNKNGSSSEGSSAFDAVQVIPIEGLGKEYIIQAHSPDVIANQFIVVVTEDGTDVDINLSVPSKKHPSTEQQVQLTKLSARSVYLVTAGEANKDLSGTTICATRPIAVFSGNAQVKIPAESAGDMTTDHAYEQMLPLDKWGKHFIVPMTAGETSLNMLDIIACNDGTTVQLVGHKNTSSVLLNKGQVVNYNMNSIMCPNKALYLSSDKPIAVYLYSTSSGQNIVQDPSTGLNIGIGNPSSTLIPPIEHMTDTTIFATYINPDLPTNANLTYFVNLWAHKDSVGTIKFNGINIGGLFSHVPNTDYSIARFKIGSNSTNTITARSKSFSGFTYGYKRGEMSLYTVGYDFLKQKDSLFVNDDEAKDVRFAEYQEANHRYYLEVNHKENGDEFPDSIYICDKVTLTFPAVIGSAYSRVRYEIEPTKYNPNRDGQYFEPVEQTQTSDNKHVFQHQFKLLPTMKDKNREPYEDFEFRMLVYHSQMLCGEALPDTLKALVRVLRQFNDTTWRIVCKTDTVHFFNDNYNHAETDPKRYTVFKFRNADDLDHDTVAFKLGENEEPASVVKKQYSRHYLTKSGCDSTVTLKLFVCDTYYTRVDTTLCQNRVTPTSFHVFDFSKTPAVPFKDENEEERITYKDVQNDVKFNFALNELKTTDTIMPFKKMYRSVIKNQSCKNDVESYIAKGAKYVGCPDTLDVYLTVMPQVFYPASVNVTEWCTKGDDNATYDEWKRASGKIIEKIRQDDPRFNDEGFGYFVNKRYYSDEACVDCPKEGCMMEYDSLVLHIAKDITREVHICQNEDTTYIFGGTGENVVKQTYRGWDYPADKLYPNIAWEEKREITIGNSPNPTENCKYESRLKLYVHPAYVEDSHLHTRKEYKDTTCITVAKGWKGKPAGRMVWSETDKQRVDASLLPVDKAGTFTFIDSLKTTTCPECKPQGCDSIERLTFIVGEEKHFTKDLHLCRNDTVEFEWKGTTHYYYGKLYDNPPATNATLVDDNLYLNTSCLDNKPRFEETFYGKTRYGCDSTWTVSIRLDSTYVHAEKFHICETEPYKFLDDQPVTLTARDEPYEFNAVVESDCKCDSGVTHYVYVHKAYLDLQDPADTTCQVKTPGATYEWTDHPKAGEPKRQIWMTNILTNNREQVWTDAIPVDKAGTFILLDSLKTKTCTDCKNGVGCDSITTMLLTVIPTYDMKFTYPLSSEGYWLWDDTLFVGDKSVPDPQGVTYSKRIVVDGADCFTHYQHHTTKDTLGHSVGTYKCDSIVTWCIKVGEVYRDTTYAPVCENCEYVWRKEDHNTHAYKDTTITQNIPGAGETIEHYAHYKTVMGFDSIYTLILTGFPTKYNGKPTTPVRTPSTDEWCQGEPYTWAGHPGQKDYLYIVADDGTTTAVHKNNFAKTITQKDSTYLIRDSMLTDTVFYNKKTKLLERVQCDSIWELKLTVHPTYNSKYHTITKDQYLCSNETLLWEHRLFVGYDYDEVAHPIPPADGSTVYDSIVRIKLNMTTDNGRLFYDSIRPSIDGTKFGCDSARFVNIHISPSKFKPLVHHIGDNDSIWKFGGEPTSTLARVTREDLVPSASIDYSDTINIREIKKFFFIDTLRTSTGCDSIVWDSVYIHQSYRIQLDTLLCSNNDWDWRKYKDVNTYHSGYYYDSLKIGPYKIDSTFVLNLTIQPGAKHYFDRNICKNDTVNWELQKIYYEENKGPIEVTYKTGSECDSILIFRPTFYNYRHFDEERLRQIVNYETDSICRFDTLIWISPGETTPHTAALRGENGEIFDHVPTDTFAIGASGDTIGIWITIYDSLHTTAPCHCDSTYTLHYYVKPAYRYYETKTICSSDTIEWRGQTLFSDTATTIYTNDSYQTTSGSCDSIYYLTVYVNQAYDSTKYDTICGNQGTLKWEGHDLTLWMKEHEQDTLPRDTFLFTNYPTQHLDYEGEACDSVFRLYLNVRPILTEEWYDTVCVSETYHLNDKSFTTSGIYTDTLTNSFGCDSFAVVHLAVVPPTKFMLQPLTVCADQNGFDITFTYDDQKGFRPRTVGIIYDSLAQACGFPKDSVVLPVSFGSSGGNNGDNGGNNPGDNPGGLDDGGLGGGGFISFSKYGQATMHIEIDMPQTEQKYLRPNVYSARIYFDNGTCNDPELQRVDFVFTVNYPDWILEQHWADAIGILNEKYNDGYTFSAYQWYKNGQELVGETKSYLFAPDYLEVGAEYSVLLTRTDDSVSLFTCPIVAQTRNNTMTPTQPYVSVVPTYVIKANPVVYIMCSQYGGDYKVYNPYGSLIQSGRFEPGTHNSFPVTLPALSGMYLFELNQENGEHRTVKVIVN